MYGIRYWRIFVALTLLVTITMSALAQETNDIPQVVIDITVDGFAIPPDIPEGAVRFTYQNNTEAPVAPFISRLNEGVTLEQLGEAMQGDPFASQALASDLGGIMVLPGVALDVTYMFLPGSHIMSNIFGGEEFVPFTVADAEGEGAAAPEADLEIGLVDFAFNAPISVPVGSYTMHLNNVGTQFHMMLIFRIDDTFPVSQIYDLLQQQGESEELPEGVEEVASWFPMSDGEQVWINLDLEPGTYLFLCPLPDMHGSGHSHDQLGMRQFVVVTEPA